MKLDEISKLILGIMHTKTCMQEFRILQCNIIPVIVQSTHALVYNNYALGFLFSEESPSVYPFS